MADSQSIKWRSWTDPSTPVPTGLTTPALPGSTRVFERCDRLLKRLCANRLDNSHDLEIQVA
ncbi:MAG: hypothetical protein M3179_02835 [Actinomycetota bacterium]|nr:hypothetical protein [Actinomycetota bacterium]